MLVMPTPPRVTARSDLTGGFRHPDTGPWNETAHRLGNNAMAIAASAHASGRLLDIGCGLKPFEPLFAPHVSEHVGVDHPDSPHALTSVDVLATAYDIPMPDSTFDTALMSEVLEHLERPHDALSEAFRLLRPGGKLILTTPFIWPLHEEPRDFYRYSPYGLRHLLDGAGFEVVDVIPVGGQWTMLGLMLGYALGQTPLARFPRLLGTLQRCSQEIGAWLHEYNYREWMSDHHMAIARRPA
jgi:ubiquinone/menaquinone biosynthesis C-methylase UbiE